MRGVQHQGNSNSRPNFVKVNAFKSSNCVECRKKATVIVVSKMGGEIMGDEVAESKKLKIHYGMPKINYGTPSDVKDVPKIGKLLSKITRK